jgi:uncharacterized membrane protein YfcA
MSIEWITVQVLAVIFIATLIRSAFGFGEALVAVPLLALLMPVEVAAPLAVLLSITVAGVIVVQDWRKIHVRSAGWLIFFTYPFTPLEQRGAAVMMSDWVELRYEEEHHQEMDHVLSGSRFGVG